MIYIMVLNNIVKTENGSEFTKNIVAPYFEDLEDIKVAAKEFMDSVMESYESRGFTELSVVKNDAGLLITSRELENLAFLEIIRVPSV